MPLFQPARQLILATAEGGDLVFAHLPGTGVCVWARCLARRVDETPRPGRRAAPLYGGGISHNGWAAMAEFFTNCSDADGDGQPRALSAPRIVDARPIKVRSGHGPQNKATTSFFVAITFSPLSSIGTWTGPAPELLFSYVRKGHYYPQAPGVHVAPDSPVRGGFFATGLPELPAGAEPDLAAIAVAAVIPEPRIALTAASLLRAVHGPRPDDPEAAQL